MPGPIGGSYSLVFRHGHSDPLPYNAPPEVTRAAMAQAADRDETITAAHAISPYLRRICPVCNPTHREVPKPVSWWTKLRWRALKGRR